MDRYAVDCRVNITLTPSYDESISNMYYNAAAGWYSNIILELC
jgi:hypothetical protein